MYMAVASAASVPSAMSRELSRNVVSGYPGSEVADGELLCEVEGVDDFSTEIGDGGSNIISVKLLSTQIYDLSVLLSEEYVIIDEG